MLSLVFLHAFVCSFCQIYSCDSKFRCFMLRSMLICLDQGSCILVLHVSALLTLFSAFCFGSMLVCLDLGLCQVFVYFPFVGLCLLVFGATLFVQLHPFPFCSLFGCNHVWLGVHLHDVWHASLYAYSCHQA